MTVESCRSKQCENGVMGILQPHEALFIPPLLWFIPYLRPSKVRPSYNVDLVPSILSLSAHLRLVRAMLLSYVWVEMHGDCIVGLTDSESKF